MGSFSFLDRGSRSRTLCPNSVRNSQSREIHTSGTSVRVMKVWGTGSPGSKGEREEAGREDRRGRIKAKARVRIESSSWAVLAHGGIPGQPELCRVPVPKQSHKKIIHKIIIALKKNLKKATLCNQTKRGWKELSRGFSK